MLPLINVAATGAVFLRVLRLGCEPGVTGRMPAGIAPALRPVPALGPPGLVDRFRCRRNAAVILGGVPDATVAHRRLT